MSERAFQYRDVINRCFNPIYQISYRDRKFSSDGCTDGTKTSIGTEVSKLFSNALTQQWPTMRHRVCFFGPPMFIVRCVDHIDHIYALQIENTSESDPRSYEATRAVAKKAQKDSKASMGFEPMTSS